jgi:hypothetical protein
VHGLWYKKVYFQIGMVVGDTQEHIKICGFRVGNGLYRQHVCRDCLVSTEDADNPDIECELREVGDAYKFLKQYLDKETYPDGKLPSIPTFFGVNQTNSKFATRNEWCRVISHNPIIPALMSHYFGGDPEGLFGATPFEVLHQLLLGLLKYIFDSLYIFRTIPKDWESFFKKRSCPEVPNRYSEANEPGLPPKLPIQRWKERKV